MAYTPENNPYIPGDPYSYDLKWMVQQIHYWSNMYDSLDSRFVDLLNQFGELSGEFGDLSGDFTTLYNYVHDFFDNLDLSEEVSAKIDEMAANGTLVQLFASALTYFVTPEMYGAKGDDITDDTQAFIAAAATGKTIALGPKTYLVTDSISLNGNVIGCGKNSTIHFTHNGNCLVIGSGEVSLRDFRIHGNAGNAATAISFSRVSGNNSFENLKIDYVRNGIRSTFAVFSSSFNNIWIDNFTRNGISLEADGGTGCVFSNIYITNWSDYSTRTMGSARIGLFLFGYSECVLQQINIEHGQYETGIYINNSTNMQLDSLHFEGFVSKSEYNGLITIYSSTIDVNDISVVYSGAASEGYANTPITIPNLAILYMISNARAYVNRIMLRDNNWSNITGSKYLAISSDGAPGQRVSIAAITGNDSFPQVTKGFNNTRRIPCVLRVGDTIYGEATPSGYARRVNNNFDIATTSLNDLFMAGDRFINSAPTKKSFLEYRVVSQGNPQKPTTGIYAAGTAYQGYIITTADLAQNDTIEIAGTRYTCTSNSYDSGNPDFPRRINVSPNVPATFTNEEVFTAAPILASVSYSIV